MGEMLWPNSWKIRWMILVVMGYFIMAVLASVGLIGSGWSEEVGVSYATPDPFFRSSHLSFVSAQPTLDIRQLPLYGLIDPLAPDWKKIQTAMKWPTQSARSPRLTTLPWGGDKWGHDVRLKVLKGTEVSLWVGCAAATVATVIGVILGLWSGFFGGWVDNFLNTLYGILTSLPYLLLVFAIAAVLHEKGITPIIVILSVTGWTGIFRLMRVEILRLKSREFVLASEAMGAKPFHVMFRHILPNTSGLILVQWSLTVIGFIKSEVILSFLGFGVAVDQVSWGSILNEAQNELVLGIWWQLTAVTVLMAGFIAALSISTDYWRDRLDPRWRDFK